MGGADAAYGNGTFVLTNGDWNLGFDYLYSTDNGSTWATAADRGYGEANSPAFGAGVFVSVGTWGHINYSADGNHWTAVPDFTGGEYHWRAVAWNGSMFVAVGENNGATGDIYASSPDGINWTAHPNNVVDGDWHSMAYGDGRFVAVGGGANRVMIGSWGGGSACSNPATPAGGIIFNADRRVLQWCDGTNWQAAGPLDPPGPNTGCAGPSGAGGEVIYNADHCTLQYCDGDNWRKIGSTDAGAWTAQTMPEWQLWRGAAFGNGTFVAVSNTNPASSPDGISWTVHNTVDLYANSSGAVAFGNGVFVAPSGGGWTRQVTTSPDGVAWTAHPNALPPSWPSSGPVSAITYGGGQFVAVGGGGAVATSPDGTSWTARTSGVTTDFSGIAYGNGLYVAVGTWLVTPTHPVVVSPDGINWTTIPAANVFNAKWPSIAFGNGRFVAKSYQGGPPFMYSADGVNWTAGDLANVYWGDGEPIFHADGRFVAAGSTTIYESDDGDIWSVLALSVPHGVMGLAYGNGTIVTVSDGTGAMRASCLN